MSARPGKGLLGVGAAACAACCAGPVLAFLGGVTVAGVVGTAFVGLLALVVAGVVAASYLLVRRRRAPACAAGPDGDGPVRVAAPVHQPDGGRSGR